jgi:hypothetical protein
MEQAERRGDQRSKFPRTIPKQKHLYTPVEGNAAALTWDVKSFFKNL